MTDCIKSSLINAVQGMDGTTMIFYVDTTENPDKCCIRQYVANPGPEKMKARNYVGPDMVMNQQGQNYTTKSSDLAVCSYMDRGGIFTVCNPGHEKDTRWLLSDHLSDEDVLHRHRRQAERALPRLQHDGQHRRLDGWRSQSLEHGMRHGQPGLLLLRHQQHADEGVFLLTERQVPLRSLPGGWEVGQQADLKVVGQRRRPYSSLCSVQPGDTGVEPVLRHTTCSQRRGKRRCVGRSP